MWSRPKDPKKHSKTMSAPLLPHKHLLAKQCPIHTDKITDVISFVDNGFSKCAIQYSIILLHCFFLWFLRQSQLEIVSVAANKLYNSGKWIPDLSCVFTLRGFVTSKNRCQKMLISGVMLTE